MAATPSHRLKLQRADKHVSELETLIAGISERRPYPVTESFDPKGETWTYRLNLAGSVPPENVPVVLGDVLFNVRSALDHIVVAIAPAKFKRRAGFPICTVDPLLTDESGAYRDADAARGWISRTEGLPDDCVAVIRGMQPYEIAENRPEPAKAHTLAILSALQNADKHRELIAVVSALKDAVLRIDGKAWNVDLGAGQPEPPFPMDFALKDGAQLHAARRKMKVEIEGSATIGVGRRDELWDVYDFVNRLRRTIGRGVLPALEPFLTEEPRAASESTGHAAPPTG